MNEQEGMQTRFSILRGLFADDPKQLRSHRERFAEIYGRPLVDYLRRCWKLDEHQAEDLAQEFILQRVLGLSGDSPLVRKYLEKQAEHPDLRFRSYLFLALRNFFLKSRRGREEATFDPQEAFDLQDPKTREELEEFDRGWAENILSRAIEAVREDCQQKPDQKVIWDVFVARILTPALTGNPPEPYEDLYQKLGLETPKQAASRLQTAMRKFREALLEVVGNYLPTEGSRHSLDRDQELLELQQTLASLNGLDFLNRFVPAPQYSQSSHSVGSLFVVGDDISVAWQEDDCKGLWSHLLSLNVDRLLGTRTGSKATLADHYFGRGTQREVLERVKVAGKEGGIHDGRTSQTPELDGLPKPIYVALYFAALAAASVHLRQSISSDPSQTLLARLSRFRLTTWLDPATTDLLSTWRSILESKD